MPSSPQQNPGFYTVFLNNVPTRGRANFQVPTVWECIFRRTCFTRATSDRQRRVKECRWKLLGKATSACDKGRSSESTGFYPACLTNFPIDVTIERITLLRETSISRGQPRPRVHLTSSRCSSSLRSSRVMGSSEEDRRAMNKISILHWVLTFLNYYYYLSTGMKLDDLSRICYII